MKYFTDMRQFADKIGLDDISMMDEFILGMQGDIQAFMLRQNFTGTREALLKAKNFEDSRTIYDTDKKNIKSIDKEENMKTTNTDRKHYVDTSTKDDIKCVKETVNYVEQQISIMNDDIDHVKHMLINIIGNDANGMAYNIDRADFHNEFDEGERYRDDLKSCRNDSSHESKGNFTCRNESVNHQIEASRPASVAVCNTMESMEEHEHISQNKSSNRASSAKVYKKVVIQPNTEKVIKVLVPQRTKNKYLRFEQNKWLRDFGLEAEMQTINSKNGIYCKVSIRNKSREVKTLLPNRRIGDVYSFKKKEPDKITDGL